MHEELDVPIGEVYLRIAVHDLSTDRIGSLEIPLQALDKAPPAQTFASLDAPRVSAIAIRTSSILTSIRSAKQFLRRCPGAAKSLCQLAKASFHSCHAL